MRSAEVPSLLLTAALLAACVDTVPSASPDLSGEYVGTGVWRSENRHNLSVLVLTVAQDADSIHGSGLISGMVTNDEGTVTYENDYVFGGIVAPGDPAQLTVSFNSRLRMERLPRPCDRGWGHGYRRGSPWVRRKTVR